MQSKSDNNQSFSERTETLASQIGVNLSDLPAILGISASMFYAYRTGKQPISLKAWRKLETAELQNRSSSETTPIFMPDTPVHYSPEKRDIKNPTIVERLANIENQNTEMKQTIANLQTALDNLAALFTPRER